MEFIENTKEGISDKKLNTFVVSITSKLKGVKKILVVHPDYTRVDFTDKIVPIVIQELRSGGAKKIDFLNASGTHREMTDSEFCSKLGIEKKESYINFFNHHFSNPDNLITIGNIKSSLVKEKTGGQLSQSIPVTVNKLIFNSYDLIIAINGTVPHEASGYSGGLKIFFPGISGPEVIDLFHWAAVLVGIPNIIGTVYNNARDIINEGSIHILRRLKTKIYSFDMVNIEKDNEVIPVGLYIDRGFEGFIRAYKLASLASSKVHVKYINRPLTQVVQVIPKYYDEIWTAGKGSYKLQKPGVMAKEGEIIIFAPHITCFHSKDDMDSDILKLGYHCKDSICHHLESDTKVCRNVAAHVINVAGTGVYNRDTKKEKLYFKVTLATGISEEVCRSVGLGYRDPKSIKRKDFSGPGKLWIEDGGKYLYDLKNRRE